LRFAFWVSRFDGGVVYFDYFSNTERLIEEWIMITKEQFAKMQDHSVLEPYATLADIDARIQETIDNGLGATYVEPCYVSYTRQKLAGLAQVGTVVGFPFGTNTTAIKIAEGLGCIQDGADCLDVVINYSRLKSGDAAYVENELKAFVVAMKARRQDIVIKVIIETCYLTHEEKVKACEIVRDSGADYIKTSTGTGSAGCRIGDIRLMRKICGDKVKIKAAAQITTIEDALAVIEEGASAIGENTAVKLLADWDKQLWE
jgi:deoxyribose-phosphate aldolase